MAHMDMDMDMDMDTWGRRSGSSRRRPAARRARATLPDAVHDLVVLFELREGQRAQREAGLVEA
jgi:hypothetical protein